MTRINLLYRHSWSFSRAFLHLISTFTAFQDWNHAQIYKLAVYWSTEFWGTTSNHVTCNPTLSLCSRTTFPGRDQTTRCFILLCLHLSSNELLCALLHWEQSSPGWLLLLNENETRFSLWFSIKALKFNASALSVFSCGAEGDDFSSCRRNNWETESLRCETSSSLTSLIDQSRKWNLYSA